MPMAGWTAPCWPARTCARACTDWCFEVERYFRAKGVALPTPAFLESGPRSEFGLADAQAHYHVPLLVSPWA